MVTEAGLVIENIESSLQKTKQFCQLKTEKYFDLSLELR